MAHIENTIQNRKNKHLSLFERREIHALQWGNEFANLASVLEKYHRNLFCPTLRIL